MMNGGMHPQARNPMMNARHHQQQQQQYGDMVYGGGNPGMMGGQGPAPSNVLGVRRSAAQMNGGGGMHPDEPPSKRYRKVISNVSPASTSSHA
jgi:hypothetical protein